MVVPGSHLAGRLPTPAESTDHTVATAIPLEAPKGSCVVYDARLWHGTGVNDGSIVDKPTGLPWRLGIFTLYCAPWARPQENMTLGALPEGVETLTEHQKTLLGLRPWYAYGRIGGAGQQDAGAGVGTMLKQGLGSANGGVGVLRRQT